MDVDNGIFPEKKTYEVDCESLGQQAVEKLIAREVDHICGILGVDVSYCGIAEIRVSYADSASSNQADTTSLLLRHMKWNKEKLIEKYMESASKVLVDAGVTLPEAPPPPPIRTTSTGSQTWIRRSASSTSKKSLTTSPLPANTIRRNESRPRKLTNRSSARSVLMNLVCKHSR